MQWRIQDFPKGGVPTLGGGRWHTNLPNFPQKRHEIERIWTRGGARFPRAPLRFATEMEEHIYYCTIWLSLEMKKKQTMTFWCAKVTQRHVTFQWNGNLRFEKLETVLRSSITRWWGPILSLKSWSSPTVVKVTFLLDGKIGLLIP